MMTLIKRLAILLAICAGAAVLVDAQQRAIAALTLQTTDTSANSLLVGCTVGSTTCTGGIKAGPISGTTAAVTALTLSGANTQAGPSAFFNSNLFTFSGGTSGYQFNNQANGVGLFTISNTGLFSFNGKWGVNVAGDHTFGASANIADSSGTPTLTTCTNCGTSSITGTDYAFKITYGTVTNNTAVTVTFGHTFASAPVCVTSTNLYGVLGAGDAVATTTTTMVGQSSTVPTSGQHVSVLCRGF
jgi:hypothetical protein